MRVSVFSVENIVMNLRGWLFGILLVTGSATAGGPARLDYVSTTDFDEINVDLKQDLQRHPGFVEVNVKLSQEARDRTAALTLLALNRQLSLYVDGRLMNAHPVTVVGVINGPSLRINVPQDVLVKWLPWGHP